eukprot:TRINITY_DN23294_c0_g2_i1.p1 TRINITY_DN23294_c0_g2~~TRINITY_DN23294_c0_g2_i1.p1  ORF type:complete len:425 (+),score=52.04 TRINITY_DN23294_c0_g2_i1:107-1381(+)
MPSRLLKDSRVAIVGGGVGGLTLANLLQREGFQKISVLERGHDVKARGGHIGITPGKMGGAMPVMEALGLQDLLASKYTASSSNVKTLKNGHVQTDVQMSMGPRIMRDALQHILLDRLKSGTVRFGKGVSSFEEQDDGVKLLFEDGTAESFDIAVACDGINSTIAAQLFPRSGKKFAGFVTYTCIARGEFLPDTIYSHQLCGDGRGVSLGGIQGFGLDGRWDMVGFTMRSDVPVSSDWEAEGTKDELDRLFEYMQKFAGEVPDSLRSVVAHSDRVMRWGIYEHEPKPTWISPGGKLVLLGDAAHAMAPYAGQGAQCAMLDALCLAKELMQDKSVSDALRAYEASRKPTCEGIVAMAKLRGLSITSSGLAAAYDRAMARISLRALTYLAHTSPYVRRTARFWLDILELGHHAAERLNALCNRRCQ